MKKIMMPLMALSLSLLATSADASASESSQRLAVLRCSQALHSVYSRTTLDIDAVLVSGKPARLIATLEQASMCRPPETLGAFRVKEVRPSGHIAGQGVRYVGRNFELRLLMVAPVDGHIRAELVAELEGRRLVEDMLCDYVR